MATIVAKGSGWFEVRDGDKPLAPPFRSEQAAMTFAQGLKPAEEPGIKSEKEWSRKLDAQLREQRSAVSEDFKALLVKHFGEDTAVMMMRSIDPILVAGKDGRRRERMRFARPIPAQSKAA